MRSRLNIQPRHTVAVIPLLAPKGGVGVYNLVHY
jgi:hypothetical protein